MNRKRQGKICIAHVVYAFDKIGGLENGLINIINNLNHDKYFHVIYSLTGLGDIQARVRADNVKYYALSKREGNDITIPFKLWQLFRRERIDVVHLRNWVTMVEGYVAAWAARIPKVVYSEHGRHFEDIWEGKKIRAAIHRYILNHVDVPLCVSGEVALEMKNLYNMTQDVTVIVNGVDTKRFSPTPRKCIQNDRVSHETVVGTVARLDKGKNLDQLIVDFITGCIADKLVIVGGGKEKRKLEQLIDHYNGTGKVILAGHLDDIPQVLNSFDVFVLPSASEGLSNVLLEAMSCGLPVISYDVGGNRELIIEGQGGCLVRLGESADLIRAVNALLSDRDKITKMGEFNRALTIEKFSINRMTETYDELYVQ